MKQSCRYTLRRHAAIGAAVAIVAASSAFGIGATAANAAPTDTATSTSTDAPTSTGPGIATGTSTSASTSATPAAPSDAALADTPATDAPAGSAAPTDTPSTAPTTTPPATTTPPEQTPAPAAPTPAPATPTPTPPAPAPTPAASTPVTWAEPSSEAHPIVLTATAGQPFSHTFVAQGGDGPLEYLFNPHSDFDHRWKWDEKTGVLSGTPTSTIDSTVLFEVTATDLHDSAVQYVQVNVEPAAAAGVALSIAPLDFGSIWSVYLDGVIHQSEPGSPDDTVVSSIPVHDGETLSFAGLAVDEYGNRVTPGEDYPRSTVTSTNAADTAVWDDRDDSNKVTFSGAGSRTVTVSEAGVSTSVRVVVSDAPEVAGFAIGVLPADGSDQSWGVVGDTITHYAADGTAERVDAVPVRQGDRVQLRALALDAAGDPVGEHSDLSITSDVASDRIEYDPEQAATWITFEHASRHVVTVSYQGVSQTIPFEVSPTVAPAVTTPTVGSTTPTASGRLAYTGADESAPLGWALGLLTAGAGLLVHRIRRRRA